MKVQKLASILRIADALDRAHSQRIRDIVVVKRGDDIVIQCALRGDLSIERYGIVSKGTMFEDTFGMTVTLAVSEISGA